MSNRYDPSDMSGRLYDNRDQRTNRKQPDFTGKVKINGKLYRISAWMNSPSEYCAVKTMSLRFDDYQEAEAKEAARNARELEKSAKAREQVNLDFIYDGE